MVSEPTWRTSFVRHLESDRYRFGNPQRVTPSGNWYKSDMRARGMERRVARPSVLTPGGVGAPCAGALATRRSMAAISVPGAVTSGRGREGCALPDPGAFAPFVRAASSQL